MRLNGFSVAELHQVPIPEKSDEELDEPLSPQKKEISEMADFSRL